MKRFICAVLCLIMLLSLSPLSAMGAGVKTVRLDLNNKSPFGAFEGWGASICWWGHHLGENLTDEQLDMAVQSLYDEKEGLGLNIARYNIGGGDDPEHNHQRLDDGRNMPGISPSEGVFDLERDKGQLSALQLAVKYGADIVEAFSNSPPYYMTESGCSSGNRDSGKNNLPDDKFDDFAEFLAEAVLRISKEYGIEFDTLEPFNESDTNFWGYEGWQEGCHFDVEDHSRLITQVRKALDKRGLTDVGVSAADEHGIWRMGENLKNVYTDEAIAALSQVNAHSYNAGGYDHLRSAAIEVGKKLYMTEVDGDATLGGKEAGNMAPALWLSQKITDDIRGLEPNAWVIWQPIAMAYEGDAKNSGYWNLCAFNKETNTVDKYKKYYAYMQYTKFIRPGDTLVKTDYGNVVAAVNEETGKVVFVITNTDTRDVDYKLDLNNMGADVKSSAVYVTDKERNCSAAGDVENFVVSVPAHSIVTVVFNCTTEGKSIVLREKNNTVSALVNEELEFAVTDENGNNVDTQVRIETNCQCMPNYTFKGNTFVFKEPHGTLTMYAEKEGMRAEYEISIAGDGSKVRIIGQGSDRALKVSGNDVVIADRTNDASQIWNIEKHGEYIAFKNEKTGKYLSTERFLTTSTINDNALWTLQADKGLFRIINKETADSIDVYNHATANGSQVGVYNGYYATPNQLFSFELAEPLCEAETEYIAKGFKLSGTPFGSAAWDKDENVTFDKAWDGDNETFFHSDRDADRTGYTGLDLGEEHMPFNKVILNSRPGFEYRGYGATLSGCNEKDGEYELIYTFKASDFARREEAEVYLDKMADYRYIKYETPLGGYCNVGEISLVYEPYKPAAWVEDGKIFVDNGSYIDKKDVSVIVSYIEGERLAKIETIAQDKRTEGYVCELSDNEYDVRIQLVGKEHTLIASFFVKKY